MCVIMLYNKGVIMSVSTRVDQPVISQFAEVPEVQDFAKSLIERKLSSADKVEILGGGLARNSNMLEVDYAVRGRTRGARIAKRVLFVGLVVLGIIGSVFTLILLNNRGFRDLYVQTYNGYSTLERNKRLVPAVDGFKISD